MTKDQSLKDHHAQALGSDAAYPPADDTPIEPLDRPAIELARNLMQHGFEYLRSAGVETEIYLPAQEYAIVTTNDGTDLQFCIPKGCAPDDEVPYFALFLTACFLRSNLEPSFVDDMIEWLESQDENKGRSEAEGE